MIKYRYDLYADLKAHLNVVRYWSWLRANNIHINYPNPLYILKLLFHPPKINYQVKQDIICYLVSGGVGGSYYLPNKIVVCPREKSHTIEEIVRHEIAHLNHEHEVQGMTHQEKEAYIESKENSW